MSSSGHLALVPRLLGWDYEELPADFRKTFEVALHVGSAPAVALALRGESSGLGAPALALTLLPPAVAGLAFEGPIERRFGDVRSVALAQVVAGAALLAADSLPERRVAADARRPPPGGGRAGARARAGRVALGRRADRLPTARPVAPGGRVAVAASRPAGYRRRRGAEGIPLPARRRAGRHDGAAAPRAQPPRGCRRWRRCRSPEAEVGAPLAAYRIALGLGALAHLSPSDLGWRQKG